MTEKSKIAIIGGGISGLSVLHYLMSSGSEIEVSLYEADNRLGGTIGTDCADGFTCDWGPNGFLDREPATLELVDELGLTGKLIRANPKAEKRFIFRNGRLHPVSPHPIKFLTSQLLSARGRARVLYEPFVSKKKDASEETIFQFAARRIGSEAAEVLVDPMVSGVFGGDARESSLRACFPKMAQMEEQYGSLVKALIAKKKEGSKGGPSGPTGRLTSFENGLYTLVEEFQHRYSEHISLGTEVSAIESTARGYRVKPGDTYDSVVFATPSCTTASLLEGVSESAAGLLNRIPYAPMAVCCFGYAKERVKHDLDGFGFLVPHVENREILGSIWTSSIFPDQAPAGFHLLRTMLGGYGNDSISEMDNNELVHIATRELKDIVGVPDEPEFVRVFKWKRAIPQYLLGHNDLISEIENELSNYPGLYLVGNSYTGVGLNDCVLRSRKIASTILDRLKG